MDLEVHDDWLRVPLGPREHADFHFRWLRHNCECDRHPTTHERTLCSSELPDDLRPVEVELVDQTLRLRWPDGHRTIYAIAWLREHAYALGRPEVPRADLAAIELFARERSPADTIDLALARVHSHGAAVVRCDPQASLTPVDATEPLIGMFEERGLRVVPTHFGRIEDLRTDNTTNLNTDQLGYTDAPVDLHTDQPFLDHPPRYQTLQCIRRASEGGANLLADALAAWRWLELDDPEAAALLRSQPVRFHRRQRGFEREIETPLVIVDGEHFMIRSSYFTFAPHRMPFDRMRAFYRAHDRFIRLLRDPRHHVKVMLEAGDWLIYDNHRTLHARTGFTGARWLRGVYFD
ncbi:TauD/TfdA family dioxygenase [Nannocystaceae bacterium ST9]